MVTEVILTSVVIDTSGAAYSCFFHISQKMCIQLDTEIKRHTLCAKAV